MTHHQHHGRVHPEILAARNREMAARVPIARPADPREVANWRHADRVAYEQAKQRNREARGRELTGAAPMHGMGYPSEISGAAPSYGSSGWGWQQDISMGAPAYWLGGQTQQAGYSPSPMYPHVHHGMSRHPRGHGFAPGAGASLEETREGVAGLAPGYMAMISPTIAMSPPGSTPITSPPPPTPAGAVQAAAQHWYSPIVSDWDALVAWLRGAL